MQPDILLADEVLAVGDLEFQERCLERVQEGGRAGMTVLFVSHDMDAITRLCDRVLWLNAGEIVRIGAPEEVVAEYQESAWAIVNRGRKTKKAGAHVCAAGEILFVRLVAANGKEVGAVRVEDDFWLNIGFRTAMPGLRVRSQIDVSARGTLAFRSVQPDPVPVDEQGEHVARVRIPPHLLAETVYTVTVTLAFFDGDQANTCILYNALSFHVYDAARGGSARGSYMGKMPGAVAPRLEWETHSLVMPGAPRSA
jgi:lipopolysaccharide transport system ATP-binding protein